MSMSKKDFIALADVLRGMKPDFTSELAGEGVVKGAKFQWEYTVKALAEFCQSQNSNFMRERWLDYIAGKRGPNGGSK